MSPRDPEFATFRDLVETVERVDDKLDEHRIEIEKRLGRIEKALVVVGIVAVLPTFHIHTMPLLEGATRLVTHL